MGISGRLLGPVSRAFASEAVPASVIACLALTGVGCLLGTAQTLLRADVLPSLWGCLVVLAGLVPALVAIALPVAALVGTVVASQGWAEGGDWRALGVAGGPARRVLWPMLALGMVAAAIEAGLTHGLEPAGRALVRRALEASASEIRIRPGQPIAVGEAMIFATQRDGDTSSGLLLARDDLVVAAATARVDGGGILRLGEGTALGLGRRGWTLAFERADWPIRRAPRRVESNERGTANLGALITRMRSRGASAHAETLTLYKRTALPAAVPFLVLLGIPLGARRVRPVVAAAATALGWWTVMRLCDHAAAAIGPLVAAAVPLGLLGVAALLVWLTWIDR